MEAGAEPKIFALSDVTKRIAGVFKEFAEKRFWVRAEIGDISLKNGAYYGSLIETQNGKQIAKLSFKLWSSDRSRIEAAFRKADLALELKSGMNVILQCSVNFHELFGLSLYAVDADPRFILGEMELRKREIIERLQRSGADRTNKLLRVPRLPMRIGVITSGESSAYYDLYKTLKHGGFGYRVSLSDATMQGDGAEASILRGLALLDQLQVDLVIIIRGGGSKTDLATLDNERIAMAIAAFSKPVWVAIGHETDSGVLDVVAHSSFKTPTALAEEIVGRFKLAERETEAALDRIRRDWTHQLRLHSMKIRENSTGIQQGSRKLADMARSDLRSRMEHMRSGVIERAASERRARDAALHSLRGISSARLERYRTHMNELRRMMDIRAGHAMRVHNDAILQFGSRLSEQRVAQIIRDRRQRLRGSGIAMIAAHERARSRRSERLAVLLERLKSSSVLPRLRNNCDVLEHRLTHVQAYDPRKALARGYAIVKDMQDRIVRTVGDVHAGMTVGIEFFDGNAEATIQGKEKRDE